MDAINVPPKTPTFLYRKLSRFVRMCNHTNPKRTSIFGPCQTTIFSRHSVGMTINFPNIKFRIILEYISDLTNFKSFRRFVIIFRHIREYQCEWHRMTRMTGPDCAAMCNLINTRTHTNTHLLAAGETRFRRNLVREPKVGQRDPAEIAHTVVDQQYVLRLYVAVQDACACVTRVSSNGRKHAQKIKNRAKVPLRADLFFA